MPIVFACPSCSSKVRVSRSAAGRHGRCPRCDATIQVPTLGEAVVDTSSSAELPPFVAPPTLSRAQVAESDRVECPACAELIKARATVCRFCGEDLAGGGRPRRAPKPKAPRAPRRSIGRHSSAGSGSGSTALAFGVLGLCVPLLAPVAIVFGVIAQGEASRARQPTPGSALAGIVLGSLGTAFLALIFLTRL